LRLDNRSASPLRVALIAPPLLPVPLPGYDGTERVIHAIAEGLHKLGHQVTLFASADSDVSCELVATVPRACWAGGSPDVDASFDPVLDAAWRQRDRFEVIHSHLETKGFDFGRASATPVISTMHGRLDEPLTCAALLAYPDIRLVAISESQRDLTPRANWVGVVRHGLDLVQMPFGPSPGNYLLFVGRIAREKGITGDQGCMLLLEERGRDRRRRWRIGYDPSLPISPNSIPAEAAS
jgi:glycosyltransferase involved in cell wall biosynthesis